MTYPDFCDAVKTLHIHHPFSVTSWFRTEMHNQDVFGSSLSGHLLGLAIDGDYDRPLSYEDEENARTIAHELGLFFELKSSRVSFHAEPLDYNPERMKTN